MMAHGKKLTEVRGSEMGKKLKSLHPGREGSIEILPARFLALDRYRKGWNR